VLFECVCVLTAWPPNDHGTGSVRWLLLVRNHKLLHRDGRNEEHRGFKIKRAVQKNAYELELPPQMHIHPVLNVSRLKAYHDGRKEFPLRKNTEDRPAPQIGADNEELYEVESIIAKRGKGARIEYLVKWRG